MIVLASASPRRAEILSQAGIAFRVQPAHIPEQHRAGESAEDYVRRLAAEKTAAVSQGTGDVVLAADTTVHLHGRILEKPHSPEDALAMLTALSGHTHEVLTGICLRRGERAIVDCAVTRVHFLAVPAAELEAYARSGEPMDKAGAYAIQGQASRFIDRIEGCYFNVVGLPVSLVWRHLQAILR
ncbi:MAG: septum formation inhibitor Maf [Acidobacteria bacterium]|nr:septum formation inhibitor Maf [Acidobacteriota bacterium]